MVSIDPPGHHDRPAGDPGALAPGRLPASRGAKANGHTASMFAPRRAVVMGRSVAMVGGLAAQPGTRPACDCFALAPSRLVGDLGILAHVAAGVEDARGSTARSVPLSFE